jgi:uncharacterized protein YbjT (DUF2867 family)
VYHLKVEASRSSSWASRVKSVTAKIAAAYGLVRWAEARPPGRPRASIPAMAIDVAVAGGHGKVALRLLQLLAERGDLARGLIRNADHAADLEAAGASAVGADLENLDPPAIADAVAGADAVVFSAGAGPGSGPARKRTVDYGAAVKLIEACGLAGISRYLMVSAMGVHDPSARGEQMRPYYEAKLEADQALAASDLDYTIVRPAMLTDEPGTGLIEASARLEHRGQISRDDVAATLLGCLDQPGTIGKEFDLLAGETRIAEALASL